MRMTEQYFNLEKLLNNQRNLDNKFKEKMGFDKIDNKFKPYKYWQMALRELLNFGIFLVVMVVVVSISYWLFILV